MTDTTSEQSTGPWDGKPTDAMQAAGAAAIRIDTTALNKLWTANQVWAAMWAVAPANPAACDRELVAVSRADLEAALTGALAELARAGLAEGEAASRLRALAESAQGKPQAEVSQPEGRDWRPEWRQPRQPQAPELTQEAAALISPVAPAKGKARQLKLWNGRAYCCYKPSDPRWKGNDPGRGATISAAAYSRADLRRLIAEYCGEAPSDGELRTYFAECWGNDMDGITPERGIWLTNDHARGHPVRLI